MDKLYNHNNEEQDNNDKKIIEVKIELVEKKNLLRHININIFFKKIMK